MLVSEIMRIKGNTLYTTTPDGAVMDAVRVMADNDIGSLVVMEGGKLAGILTFREVLAAMEFKTGKRQLTQGQKERRATNTAHFDVLFRTLRPP